jgi:type 1 glutamine amidotransferase
VHFQLGHKKELFDSPTFTRLFLNAIRWAADRYSEDRWQRPSAFG